MKFKLLAFLFNFGKFLAHTPSSIKVRKKNGLEKVYSVILLAFLTGLHVVSIINYDFFLDYIHLKVVLCFLDEISLYALNFYYIIILGIFHNNKWKHLINHLKATTYLIPNLDNNVGENFNFHYMTFMIALVAHLGSSGFVMYVGFKLKEFEYIKQRLVYHILVFLDFFDKFVLCVVLKMLVVRYKGLSKLLENFLSLNKQQTKLPQDFMKEIERAMCLLRKTVDIYNGMFAWPTFLIICFTTLELLNSIDFAMFYNKDTAISDNLVLNGVLLLWIFLESVVFVMMTDSVLQEAQEVVSLSYDLRLAFVDSEVIDDLKYEEFTNLLEKNLPNFSAANFFDVGRWTILSLLGTVVTFLIVMIQFATS